jgi:glycosyltransferase involved in cell wall biosynthesis
MGATVVSEPEAGSYVARNTGIEHAEDDYIAFTDADAEPDPASAGD